MPVRAQYAINMRAVLAVEHRRLRRGDDTARALGRNGPSQRRHRRAGEITGAISPAVHNYRGFMAQAAKEYEALLPLIDPRAPAVSIRRAARQLRFHTDRARRFRPGARRCTPRRSSSTRRSARKMSAPSNWPRWADSISAWATPNARSRRCAPRSSSRNASRDTAGLASTLRVAANAASTLGQHDAALDYLRKSAQNRCEPTHRRAHARAHRGGTARRRRTRRSGSGAARAAGIFECAGARRRARGTRAPATRAEPARRRRSKICARRTVNTPRSAWNSIASIRTPRLSQALLRQRDVTGAAAAARRSDRDRHAGSA